ncbi:MAG: hypothetical protein EOO43_01875 [Flavobacterium sp.]|nr:MAG: hypothetical protein EOO43_01875 [Flavobacterium sp.]
MSENNITVLASEFTYPSKEELIKIYESTPSLSNFGFKQDDNSSPFSQDLNLVQEYKSRNLPYWDGVLLNRNGSFSQSYYRAMVNYMRGVPDDVGIFEHKDYVNRMQFDYYAEAFYYYFSSIKDTIGQILNIYYVLRIPDSEFYFNWKLLKQIPDPAVVDLIKSFFKATQVANNYRNSFAHRTPINHPDTRISVEWETSTIIYPSTKDSYEKSSMIKANMEQTIDTVAKFLNDLKPLLR